MTELDVICDTNMQDLYAPTLHSDT